MGQVNTKRTLTWLIFGGLVLGAALGQAWYDPTWKLSDPPSSHAHATLLRLFDFLGFTVFMGLLKMLIIPLIASSVVVAVTGVGDFKKLGRLGTWTLVYYFSTMLIAVGTGLVVVNLFSPGVEFFSELSPEAAPAEELVDSSLESRAAGGVLGVFENLSTLMIPTNIIEAMAKGQTLGVIVFSIFFGVVVSLLGRDGEPIVRLANSCFAVLMRMVDMVLWLAPIGVFALLAWSVARIGLGVFSDSIGKYMLTVIIGLFVHGIVVLPAILWIVTRRNPFSFMGKMRPALITAIGTDSSSATLPVTMECATESGEVSTDAAGLVLPLGATINMDGTALYEAVAVVFMAQAYGISLGTPQMILIAFTATLAAIGAAGIPSAGLVTMLIVLDTVNGSLTASGATTLIPLGAIGLIIGVDRILDMLRTAVNVWGDAVGARLVSELDTEK